MFPFCRETFSGFWFSSVFQHTAYVSSNWQIRSRFCRAEKNSQRFLSYSVCVCLVVCVFMHVSWICSMLLLCTMMPMVWLTEEEKKKKNEWLRLRNIFQLVLCTRACEWAVAIETIRCHKQRINIINLWFVAVTTFRPAAIENQSQLRFKN